MHIHGRFRPLRVIIFLSRARYILMLSVIYNQAAQFTLNTYLYIIKCIYVYYYIGIHKITRPANHSGEFAPRRYLNESRLAVRYYYYYNSMLCLCFRLCVIYPWIRLLSLGRYKNNNIYK